jgi:hypothetical protein
MISQSYKRGRRNVHWDERKDNMSESENENENESGSESERVNETNRVQLWEEDTNQEPK